MKGTYLKMVVDGCGCDGQWLWEYAGVICSDVFLGKKKKTVGIWDVVGLVVMMRV